MQLRIVSRNQIAPLAQCSRQKSRLRLFQCILAFQITPEPDRVNYVIYLPR